MEKLILNNQLSIMWALYSMCDDLEIKNDLKGQINETEEKITEIIINEGK